MSSPDRVKWSLESGEGVRSRGARYPSIDFSFGDLASYSRHFSPQMPPRGAGKELNSFIGYRAISDSMSVLEALEESSFNGVTRYYVKIIKKIDRKLRKGYIIESRHTKAGVFHNFPLTQLIVSSHTRPPFYRVTGLSAERIPWHQPRPKPKGRIFSSSSRMTWDSRTPHVLAEKSERPTLTAWERKAFGSQTFMPQQHVRLREP